MFYNIDQILTSRACCECVFYTRNFNNHNIALFSSPKFPPQASPKILELLYSDLKYTINLEAIPASYDIKYIRDLLKLREQQQRTKQI